MGCIYVRTSVLNETGIEQLITTVIDKSIELENLVTGSISSEEGQNSIENGQKLNGLGGDGRLKLGKQGSGEVDGINPVRLNVKKKEKRCCNGQ